MAGNSHSIYNAGITKMVLGVLLFGSTGLAADLVAAEATDAHAAAEKSAADLRSINVNKIASDLKKEFDAIARAMDARSDGILEQVRVLRKEQARVRKRIAEERAAFVATMTRDNIPASDSRYLDGVKAFDSRTAWADRAVAAVTAGMKRLFAENAASRNELLKIHNARESLETVHEREQRGLLADADGVRADFGRQNGVRLREDILKRALRERHDEIKTAYLTRNDALEQYRLLVESRLWMQNRRLEDYAAIAADIGKSATKPERLERIAQRLRSLEAGLDADAEKYRTRLGEFMAEMPATFRASPAGDPKNVSLVERHGSGLAQTDLFAPLFSTTESDGVAVAERACQAWERGLARLGDRTPVVSNNASSKAPKAPKASIAPQGEGDTAIATR